MSDKEKMKPVIILKTGTMSQPNIQRLRDNGFCVVVSDDPATVRFMDPPPQGYSVHEEAAIQLARFLLREGTIGGYNQKQAVGALYANILMEGDPLKRVPHVDSVPTSTGNPK